MDKQIVAGIKLEPELKQRLRLMAAYEGVSMSEMVRLLIERTPVVGTIKDGKIEFSNKPTEE
jgi:predicted DNA-binding protein